MCHGVNFSKEVQLRDIIDSESARLSTVDYERFTAAREDAKQGLIRARNAHIEEMLSPSLDRLLYEHLFEVSDYAVPKLSRQVGLMKLSSEEALQVVADSYDGRARLHILLGINDREQALNLISERYGNANYEGGDPSLSPTKTSTKKAAQWSLQLLKAESAQAKLPPIKIKLKSKNSYLMFVWALPAQHHADFVPLQAAAHLLAQDLDLSSVIEMKIELRKYGSRFQILFRNNDALTPSEALSKIRERITAISSEPNLPQRIKALRSVIKTRFWAQMDPPIQRIESLARAGISGGNVESLARELNAIDKLTRNQLVRVLSEYFVLRTPLTAIGEAKKK